MLDVIFRRCKPLPNSVRFVIGRALLLGQSTLEVVISDNETFELIQGVETSIRFLCDVLHKVTYEYPEVKFQVVTAYLHGDLLSQPMNIIMDCYYEDPETHRKVTVSGSLIHSIKHVSDKLNKLLRCNVYYLNFSD